MTTVTDPGADTATQLADVALAHMRTDTSGCHCGGMQLGESYPRHLAAALLPVVDAIARHRAAAELDEAADNWPPTWAVDPPTYLRDRADALRAQDTP